MAFDIARAIASKSPFVSADSSAREYGLAHWTELKQRIALEIFSTDRCQRDQSGQRGPQRVLRDSVGLPTDRRMTVVPSRRLLIRAADTAQQRFAETAAGELHAVR